MKGVRRKENHKRYLKRTKKRDESDGDDLFSLLPLDLKIEILLKLPPTSLSELILASKLWSSILRGQDFTKLYRTRSSFRLRPRFLFGINKGGMQFFQSCSQEDRSSDHHKVSMTKNPYLQHKFCSPPAGGLICYRNARTDVVIGNPFTGQFVTLPSIKSRGIIFTYFGYDPVNDLYKVLCMAANLKKPGSRVVSEAHQVFTLGDQTPNWRKIKCKHPHLPCQYFQGLCKNGVVYYFAWINSTEKSLISFNMRSEEFNVIKLPEDVKLVKFHNQLQYNLVKYSGKIAITSRSYGTLDLRVLEDVRKHEWSKVYVKIPSWTDLVGSDQRFRFRGATNTGELIFAPYNTFPNSSYILCYDPKENNTRKVLIEGTKNVNSVVEVFFDHYESPMILPKVNPFLT